MAQGTRVSTGAVVGLVAFILLVLVANPVGDALTARGVSPVAIGVGLSVAALACLGVSAVLWVRHRRRQQHHVKREQQRALRRWTDGVGWQRVDVDPDPEGFPEVLRRARLGDTRDVRHWRSADGRSTMSLWQLEFSHWGSPVVAEVGFLSMVTVGLPTELWLGMGKTTGVARYALSPSRSPRLWAKLPPSGLPMELAQHPWGVARTAVWPGPGTPTADDLAPVAAGVDALNAWVLVQGGRMQVAVEVDGRAVEPQRLADLHADVLRLLAPQHN